jgi:hypothetical protein
VQTTDAGGERGVGRADSDSRLMTKGAPMFLDATNGGEGGRGFQRRWRPRIAKPRQQRFVPKEKRTHTRLKHFVGVVGGARLFGKETAGRRSLRGAGANIPFFILRFCDNNNARARTKGGSAHTQKSTARGHGGSGLALNECVWAAAETNACEEKQRPTDGSHRMQMCAPWGKIGQSFNSRKNVEEGVTSKG